MNLSSMLGRWMRQEYEAQAGRIIASPGGWLFDPPQWLIDKTISINPCLRDPNGGLHSHLDADGRTMFVVYQRTVKCPCRKLCEGKYPRVESNENDSVWYYPERLCQKCQYREKTSRKFRFPRCLLRASEEPEKEAVKVVFGGFQEAVNDMERIIR